MVLLISGLWIRNRLFRGTCFKIYPGTHQNGTSLSQPDITFSVISLHFSLDISNLPSRLLLGCPPQIILTGRCDRILARVVFADTCGYWSDRTPPVKSPEEWNRVPFTTTLINHTMYRAYEEVVCLSHKAICDIDDERSRNRVDLDPAAGFAQDLQAFTVRSNDSEVLHVGMCSNAVLVVPRCLLLWIVHYPCTRFRSPDSVVERVLWYVKRQCEEPSELSRKTDHCGLIGTEWILEVWHVRWPHVDLWNRRIRKLWIIGSVVVPIICFIQI